MRSARKSHLADALFRAIKGKREVEWKRASDVEKADMIALSRLPMQEAVAKDQSRRVAVRCPRRAGKSFTALSIALERCLRRHHSDWVIVGLTKDSVRAIYWRQLKLISEKMELGIGFHNTFMTATFPNGSTLRFLGGSTRDEIEKLRGAAYHGVVVDECKSINPVVFEELISDVIGPALSDHAGTLYLIGTPGSILAGPFYEATCEPPVLRDAADGRKIYSNWKQEAADPKPPHEWSLHTWTTRANDSIREADGTPRIWKEALEEKARKGWSDGSPTWRREYLGEWVQADNLLVYRYNSGVNAYDGVLPEGHRWVYVMGADFGYKDAFAIVVWAYSPTCPGLYEVASVGESRQTVQGMVDLIRRVEDGLGGPVSVRVGDPGYGGLNIMATLGQEHDLPFIVAEKSKKLDHINHFNDDLERGLIHIVRGGGLEKELLGNRWLERSLGKVPLEDPSTPNDLCDSALYAWRFCRHRITDTPAQPPVHGSAEWWAAYEAAMEQRVIERELAKALDSELDSDAWGN